MLAQLAVQLADSDWKLGAQGEHLVLSVPIFPSMRNHILDYIGLLHAFQAVVPLWTGEFMQISPFIFT